MLATAYLLSSCTDGTDPQPTTILLTPTIWSQETTDGQLVTGSIYPAIAGDWLGSGDVVASQAIAEPVALEVADNGLPAAGLPERIPARTEVDPPFDQAGRIALFDAAGVPEEWRADLDAIIECESHWNPAAIGDNGNSLGLGQLWRGWAREGEDLLDPITNLRVAVRVRELRGRFGGGGGWTCATILGIE